MRKTKYFNRTDFSNNIGYCTVLHEHDCISYGSITEFSIPEVFTLMSGRKCIKQRKVYTCDRCKPYVESVYNSQVELTQKEKVLSKDFKF